MQGQACMVAGAAPRRLRAAAGGRTTDAGSQQLWAASGRMIRRHGGMRSSRLTDCKNNKGFAAGRRACRQLM